MTLTAPVTTFSDDIHVYTWEEEGLQATVERFIEDKTDVRVELLIESSKPPAEGQLYYGQLLLMGPNSRRTVRQALENRDNAIDWGGVLEQICTMSMRRFREGAPTLDLLTAELGPRRRWLVKPFVLADGISMVYGAGGDGKSLLSLVTALCVATGQEIAGLEAEQVGSVLLLDWEDGAEGHQERLRAICREHGLELPAGRFHYQRMSASLRESVRDIRKIVAKTQAKFVIVDSIGMACGGDPSDANLIIQTLISARQLGVPVLGVHHIAKNAKDKSNPYGSVYATNEVRLSWHIESTRQGNQLASALRSYKGNRTGDLGRLGYRWTFREEEEEITGIRMLNLDLRESRKIGDTGQKWRIADALKTGGALTVDEIAELTEIRPASVRTNLNRESTMFVKVDDKRWGLADGIHASIERQLWSVTTGEVVTPVVTPVVTRPDYGDSESEEGIKIGNPSETGFPTTSFASDRAPVEARGNERSVTRQVVQAEDQDRLPEPPWADLEDDLNDGLAGL